MDMAGGCFWGLSGCVQDAIGNPNGIKWLPPKPFIETDVVKIEINVWRFDPCRIGRNNWEYRTQPRIASVSRIPCRGY
jgi:hypothetical protein